jgi:PhnB protein
MAKLSRFDRLDAAVEAILTHSPLPGLSDPDLPVLAEIAADLRDLPRDDFRQTLKNELQRRSTMATLAPETPKVKPIPEGYHTATPYLIAHNAAAAIEFYKNAFGATELFRMAQPDGRIGHAEIQIGDSHIMLADEFPEMGIHSPQHYGGSAVSILLYVADVDAVFAQAVAAGAKVDRPVADQFYGDRNGGVIDPFGHRWFVATHIKDVDFHQPPAAEPKPDLHEAVRSITPYLQVEGAARLIDFMKQAFGAEERLRVPAPDGKIMHADVKIGDSIVELADTVEQYKPTPTALHVYVRDVDAVYQRALEAGAVSIQAPSDQEYGERSASVRDPLGNQWYAAAHLGPSYIPEGMRTVTPYLHPLHSGLVIDFLKQAFGAEELFRAQAPDGTVHHARIRIGDSLLEMGDAHGEYQPMPTAIHLHVADADAVFEQALRAGGTEFFPLKDAPYGERIGGVTDPFGNIWYIATITQR